MDYFKDLENKLSNENSNIKILSSTILRYRMNHTFDLFKFGLSDKAKYIYKMLGSKEFVKTPDFLI